MHCLHTFGLNAKAIGDLFSIMQRMPVPRQTEAVLRLAPRVDMVALDLTVVECSRVLRALGRCNAAVRPASTVKALCATIKKFAADETNPLTICGTICAVAECDVTQARVLLGVYSDLLQRVIAEPSDADHDILREVVFTLSAVGQGPRQLLNSVCRTSVRVGLSLSAEDIANVIHCMHVCSHRGEAVMRRLASLQLTQPEKQTPETVALTLAGMAHFNIFDNELYCGLMRCTAASMDGEHAASVVHSCLRVLCFQEWVWELVLRPAFLSHLPRQSTRALGAVLLYIAEGKLCETRARETSMILTELSRRDDVQTRENVLRAVLALQQQTKSAAMLEQLATLTSKV
jgi:hypothetical protein